MTSFGPITAEQAIEITTTLADRSFMHAIAPRVTNLEHEPDPFTYKRYDNTDEPDLRAEQQAEQGQG
jgi:hypothetical protein